MFVLSTRWRRLKMKSVIIRPRRIRSNCLLGVSHQRLEPTAYFLPEFSFVFPRYGYATGAFTLASILARVINLHFGGITCIASAESATIVGRGASHVNRQRTDRLPRAVIGTASD